MDKNEVYKNSDVPIHICKVNKIEGPLWEESSNTWRYIR